MVTFYRSATAVLLLGSAWLTGCVERKITIVSSPPGALVYLNDVEIGRAPVTTPFLWYGDYDVRLRYDKPAGPDNPQPEHYYLHTHRRAEAPWFQWIGPDLLAELSPAEFKDDKLWAFVLEPIKQDSDAELIKSAKQLQGRLNEYEPLRNTAKPK